MKLLSTAIKVSLDLLKRKTSIQLGWIVIFQVVSKTILFFCHTWAIRCLGPEKLGISSMVFNLILPFQLLCTFRLDVALIRNFKTYQQENHLQEIIIGVFSFQLINSVLILAPTFFTLWWFETKSEWMLPLTAGGLLCFINASKPTWVYQARKQMPFVYACNIVFAVVCTLLFFTLVRPGATAGIDIILTFVAHIFIWSMLWWKVLQGTGVPRCNHSIIKEMYHMAWSNRWVFLTVVFANAQIFIGPILLGTLGSMYDLGLFRPIQVILTSLVIFTSVLSQMLYPLQIEWKRDIRLFWKRQQQLVMCGISVALLATLMATMVSPWFFKFVFGPNFVQAVAPFCIIFCSLLLQFVASILQLGLWAESDDMSSLLLRVPMVILTIGAFILYIPQYGMMGMAVVCLVSEILMLLGLWTISYNKNRAENSNS